NRRQLALRAGRLALGDVGVLGLGTRGGELDLGLGGTGAGDDPLTAGDELAVHGDGTLLGGLGATHDRGGVAPGGVAQPTQVGAQAAVVHDLGDGRTQFGDALAQFGDALGQLAQLLVGQVTGASGGVQRVRDLAGFGTGTHDFSSVVSVVRVRRGVAA